MYVLESKDTMKITYFHSETNEQLLPQSVPQNLQLIFLLILGSIKSSYLGPVKRKEKNKEEAERKKEENKRKKIKKELQCITKKNIELWSSESDLDDDEEDEVEDEYRQEEESSEDLEESVNHVELGMQHSPTKNPKKQKKNN